MFDLLGTEKQTGEGKGVVSSLYKFTQRFPQDLSDINDVTSHTSPYIKSIATIQNSNSPI